MINDSLDTSVVLTGPSIYDAVSTNILLLIITLSQLSQRFTRGSTFANTYRKTLAVRNVALQWLNATFTTAYKTLP